MTQFIELELENGDKKLVNLAHIIYIDPLLSLGSRVVTIHGEITCVDAYQSISEYLKKLQYGETPVIPFTPNVEVQN